jgi:Tfp pilus assembly protein PilF
MNNFYLYRPQRRPQHRVIAWDEDLAFLDTDYSVTSFQDENVLVRKLMEVPEYRSLYWSTLNEAVVSASEGKTADTAGALEAETRRRLDLIDQAMLADTQRPWTDSEYLEAREYLKQFAPRRARYVECEVARLTRAARPCS